MPDTALHNISSRNVYDKRTVNTSELSIVNNTEISKILDEISLQLQYIIVLKFNSKY